MATAGRSETDTTSETTAARLREAGFVRLAAVPTGDAVGAAALLAGGLDAVGTPYQLSVGLPGTTARSTDTDLTVGVGHAADDPEIAFDDAGPVSRRAAAVATDLGALDPVVSAAGPIAAGARVDTGLPGDDTADGERRQPGVATPPVDPAAGIAHSTLIHASFSGRPDRAAELLVDVADGESEADADADRDRAIASLVALTVAEEATTTSAPGAVERLLRPLPGGPLGTAGALGDALDVLADARPGLATALALGRAEDHEATILDAWRDGARRVHESVRTAELARYDGLVVAETQTPAPIAPTARLIREFRSPEPVAVLIAESAAMAVSPPDEGPDLATATASIEAAAGTPDSVVLSDLTARDTFVERLREVA